MKSLTDVLALLNRLEHEWRLGVFLGELPASEPVSVSMRALYENWLVEARRLAPELVGPVEEKLARWQSPARSTCPALRTVVVTPENEAAYRALFKKD